MNITTLLLRALGFEWLIHSLTAMRRRQCLSLDPRNNGQLLRDRRRKVGHDFLNDGSGLDTGRPRPLAGELLPWLGAMNILIDPQQRLDCCHDGYESP